MSIAGIGQTPPSAAERVRARRQRLGLVRAGDSDLEDSDDDMPEVLDLDLDPDDDETEAPVAIAPIDMSTHPSTEPAPDTRRPCQAPGCKRLLPEGSHVLTKYCSPSCVRLASASATSRRDVGRTAPPKRPGRPGTKRPQALSHRLVAPPTKPHGRRRRWWLTRWRLRPGRRGRPGRGGPTGVGTVRQPGGTPAPGHHRRHRPARR